MLSKIVSACLEGIEAYQVDVEADVSSSLPGFNIVGLPDTAIRESRDRIRSAIKNSGYHFPSGKITVNLSPAGMRKEGAGLDLPIALAILGAGGLINQEELDGTIFCGELLLNGRLRPFRGSLAVVLSMKRSYTEYIMPGENAEEAANVDGIDVFGADSLSDVVEHLKGISLLHSRKKAPYMLSRVKSASTIDLKDIKGQEHVKRALEVAASGGHNVLLLGPPGSGKSMLAKRFPGILPPLTKDEAIEITNIYGVAGHFIHKDLAAERPVRGPHHTISYAAMSGGGSNPSPGEISLAHNGVLFLDEFPEFRRDVLETLRQPLESGEITISRSQRSAKFPSRFILVAAMNPCPCGYFTDNLKACQCSPLQIQRYLSRISGPLLDRIDLHVEVPRLDYKRLSGKRTGEPSSTIRERVSKAQNIQRARFPDKTRHSSLNAYMNSTDIEKFCGMSDASRELLKSAILELGISARAYDKLHRISRTIADMDFKDEIQVEHISEAISYRCLDRSIWV